MLGNQQYAAKQPSQQDAAAVALAEEYKQTISLKDAARIVRSRSAGAPPSRSDLHAAHDACERALVLDPSSIMAERTIALIHARLGDLPSCITVLASHVATEEGRRWLQDSLSAAMAERDLSFAGTLASAAAALYRGSPILADKLSNVTLPRHEPRRRITIGTLDHDIAQLAYLMQRAILPQSFDHELQSLRDLLARRQAAEKAGSPPLEGDDLAVVDKIYNRILHVRDTPRLARALSPTWAAKAVEDHYLRQKHGVVVIDDFLTPEALTELRAFCLESTVWLANRYAHGRLGALFHSGFSCPLLMQIAEEIRTAFPRVIGDRHTLRQLWGFKNAPFQPGNSTTHADFAAVNVNFWITPEEANLDPKTGGLIIYNVDAPPHWDFSTYNGRHDVIRPFLDRQGARSLMVPYRQNRAIIFNSDLFHCTDTVKFGERYEDRRINITALYGVREDDTRRLAKPDPLTDPGHQAWRSAALRRR